MKFLKKVEAPKEKQHEIWQMEDGTKVFVKLTNPSILSNERKIVDKLLSHFNYSDHHYILAPFYLDAMDETLNSSTRIGTVIMHSDAFDYFMSSDEALRKQQSNILETHIQTALTYLHSIGIAHCDVKPENIVYNDNKNEFLLHDFDLSVLQTDVNTAVFARGTPRYMIHENEEEIQQLEKNGRVSSCSWQRWQEKDFHALKLTKFSVENLKLVPIVSILGWTRIKDIPSWIQEMECLEKTQEWLQAVEDHPLKQIPPFDNPQWFDTLHENIEKFVPFKKRKLE